VIVLDTNVVSELMRATPERNVGDWVRSYGPGVLGTSSITVGEVRYGIERLPPGRRREDLQTTWDCVYAGLEERTLPFDGSAARQYARISAGRRRLGTPIHILDAQIAAICRMAGAQLATRNVRDFLGTGVELINPWELSV